MADYCPVAKKPTLTEISLGHFRACDGVFVWNPPIKVLVDARPTPVFFPTSTLARAVCCLALLIAGCDNAAPRPPEDLRPWVAVTGMYALMSPSPAPLPPAPAPGAKCENCRGTGLVGDGNGAGNTCPVCKGSGVTPVAVSPAGAPDTPQARSAAPGASGYATRGPSVSTEEAPVFRVVCEDGTCRRIKIQPNATAR